MRQGRIFLVWVLLGTGVLALAGRDLETPGLYYDEALHAGPALEFLDGEIRSNHVPGSKVVWLAERPVFVRAQAYLGGLKTQVLVPVFALFGGGVAVLRAATLSIALLGLLAAMLWTERIAGAGVAVLLGLILASDASFVLGSRHDWGPFALAFLCKALGLWLALRGFSQRRWLWIGGAGVVFGLGVYHKADFSGALAVAFLAFGLAAPKRLVHVFREQRPELLVLLLGFALGSLPVWFWIGDILQAGALLGDRTDLTEKFHAALYSLDGSYFRRLVESGGRFEKLAAGNPRWAVPWAALYGAGVLMALVSWRKAAPAFRFACLASSLGAVVFFVTPGAARLHHVLNLYPFPQLLLACAVVHLWRERGRIAGGVAGSLVLVGVVAGALATARDLAWLRDTGGRGRWSDAIYALADYVQDRGGRPAVSLDWGSNEPLRFLTRDIPLTEPVWEFQSVIPGQHRWELEGTPDHTYLLLDGPHALYPFGARFLREVERSASDSARIRRFPDREGRPAFAAIHFDRPHVISFSGGFKVKFP